MKRPETRYARTADGLSIGYQEFGGGQVDIVLNQGSYSNVDAAWDVPVYAEFYRALARRARVILFDRRGMGVSDRPGSPDEMALEKAMDDMRVVMDAVGSERAVVMGFESGASVGVLFAASHPDRTLGLVLYAPAVSYWRTSDYPGGFTEAWASEWVARVEHFWGTSDFWRRNLEGADPSPSDEEIELWARWSRLAASPGAALAIEKVEQESDVRAILPHIRVPTLVMVKPGDSDYWPAAWIADRIPGARCRELPGTHHWPLASDAELFGELDGFLASIREEQASFDRVLATVLFTDIVDSTATAAVLGDARWRRLIDEHDRAAMAIVARYRGEYVHSTGDGLLATFDGPARAVRCAQAIVEAARPLGVEVRAGLHTGEVERAEHGVAGVGVHIGARVGAMAGPGEVWVSSTVKDLTAGAGLVFEDRGEHELKGVPDRWHLYRVAPVP
jgi:class 3 adenylate cyclase